MGLGRVDQPPAMCSTIIVIASDCGGRALAGAKAISARRAAQCEMH
jgi:hypothetical protein